MATIDLGKIAITPEGQWSAGKYYEKLSLVIYNGQSYLSLRNTTGDNPETSRGDWMQITSRGESLYQMMVREGKFVGTEEEFLQQYLDSLKACADASEEVRAALSDILNEMDRVRAEISEVMVEEDIRIKNEAKREAAEINRRNAEITRGVEERNRQEAEQRREQSMQQIQNDAEIALAMAAEAQQKAEEAIVNEEERISAENQRKIDEATRIQHEEQRVNDEAMRRSREADRLESENIRQKNEGDRILAEREREEIMRNLVEELKGLAANKFKIVDVLPEVGEFAVIYLVPSTMPSNNDVYDEWAYVSEKWERIGSTRFEIDNYYTKEEIEAALATKANIQHQHTVADITDFPELYYDATAFFASGAYPSDKYEELLEAVKAKRTVYATIDEAGYTSYIFFISSANSDGSSSRVLLTTIFADGGYLYINTFVLQQSGMTPLQESITGKADKATTLAGYGIGDAYTKSEVDTALNTKQNTLTPGNGISIKGNVISSTVDSLITPITYAELVALRDSSSLVAGMQYRITDYACTTTQENTQSAGHPFDIIVTADSENTLNEEARAIQHEGDTYFTDCNLSAWKIWYCLDNDATRFAWADSVNGKGVIYRMIDEWNNDVPYDFKNIMFKRYILDANNAIATDVAKDGELNAVKTRLGEMSHRIHTSLWYYGEYVTDVYPNAEAGRKYVPFGDILYNDNGPGVLCPINEANSNWFYTFSDTSFNDNTLTGQGNVHDNVVKGNKYALVTIDGEGRYRFEEQENICLNDIIFIGNSCYSNSFGNDCYNNSFGNDCYSNSFGNSCNYNSFGNYCNSNSFGNDCNYNPFGHYCYYNSFGNSCYSNSFGNSCYSNTFGNSCSSNSFGNDCNYNSFGNYCYSNSFGNSCYSNSFGNYCNSNSFGNSCNYNSFGNSCNTNSFGGSCYYNSFGNSCNTNSFGNYCYYNSFGNYCYYIRFASTSSATTKYNYYRYNHFGDGCQFILFKGAETASLSAQVQNYNFAQGVQGTSSAYLTIDGVRSRAYETKVAKNSSGVLKIYCEADLIQ